MTEPAAHFNADDTVYVSLHRRANRTHFLRIELRSQTKPAYKSNVELDPDDYDSRAAFERKIEACGGALAEHQIVQYGDKHEPSAIAAMVLEAFQEMIAEAEAAGLNNPN